MTSQEADEVVALPSLKRRHERLAGKLSAKLLARNGTDAWSPSETAALMRYQVLSDNSPVRLTYDGKPLSDRPHFSISHTDDLVCAARADAPVGVDVERVRSLPEKTVHDICGTALIQKMRDEAHRFGITHHRQRRSNNSLQSELLEIKGIGDKTFELLLKKYKSVKKLKEVPEEELKEAVGESKAKILLAYFQQQTPKG